MRIERRRLIPGGRDRYGDPVEHSSEDWTDLPGITVAPRMSESVDERGRAGVVVGLTLYGPPGLDVTRHDEIRVDGEPWRIVGEIGVWVDPVTGVGRGVEVALERGEG